MTQNFLKLLSDICDTFSKITTTFTTPIDELLKVEIFGNDVTILGALIGAGVTIFVGYTLLKWVIPV